ncbi:MAG: hypothetical protein AB7W16_19745 [Candidatus Obscuribacterales bacterium]
MAFETGDSNSKGGNQQQGSVVDDILHLKDDKGSGQATDTTGQGQGQGQGQDQAQGQGQIKDQGENATVQANDTTGQHNDVITGDPEQVKRQATERLSTEALDTEVEQANSTGPKPVPKELEGEIVFDQPAPQREVTDTTGGRVESLDEIIRNAGAIQKEVNDVVQHMDAAGARLREINAGNPSEQEKDQRLLRAMDSFTEATRVVTPEEQEAYKRQREIVKKAMESETDVEKLKELKIIERNLNVLEHAPGFTRGNAALALYQAGKIRPVEMDGQMISPARKWLEDAIKADPSLIHDENFHRRRREIERKFDVDIAKDMIDFIDTSARSQGTGQDRVQGQGQDQDQGQGQDRPRPVGDGTDNGVEQPQPGNLSPSRNGKSPYENAAAAFQAVSVVDESGARQIKWPEDPAEAQRIKAQFEQAIADADAGDTPNRAALEERIADAENKKVQTQLETSKGTETVAQTAVRVTQSMTQVFGNLPAEKQDPAKDLFVKMNEAKTMDDYRKSATELKTLVGENPEFDTLMADHAKAAETYINFSNQSELLSRKLAFEVNDSATVRSLYATALKGSGNAEDQTRVKELSADAYGRNIDGTLIDQLRSDALANGVSPATLLDAALKRPEQDKDGGSYGGMSLDVMTAEASLLFNIARGANKPEAEMPDQATLTANTAAALEQFGPLFDRLENVTGGKVAESEANRAKIIEQRDQLLPQEPEKKTRALELQGQISGFDGFNDTEIDKARVLITPDASAEDVAAARKALTDGGKGEWLGKFDEWRGLVGDNASKLLMLQGLEYNNDSQTVTFRDLQFRARGMHSQALLDGGKQSEAKDKLKEALDGLPEDMRGQYAGSPKVSELAGKVGLDLAPYNPVANQGDQGTGDQGQGQGQGQGTLDRTADGGDASEPPRDMRLANMSDTELMQSVIDAATVKVKATDAEGKVTEGILENNDLIQKNIQPIRVGLEELIRRNDSIAMDGKIVPFDYEEEARNVAKMQEMLRTGKNPDTGETVNLTDADRFQLHRGIINTFRIAQNQVDYRLQLAEKLRVAGQYEDATRYYNEAIEKADLIKKNFMPDGKDMIKAEIELASTDTAAMDNAPRFPVEAGGEPSVGYADVLNEGIARISGASGSSPLRLAPVEARIYAANHALGAKVENTGQFRPGVTFSENGTDKPMPVWTDTYGQRPGWSGAEGGRLIKEAVDQFESIEGYNPLKAENQARSQLTGQMGVLVDRAKGMSDEHLQSFLKETSGFDQALSFGAAMTAAGLLLVATAGTRGKEGKPVVASMTRSLLRVGAAVTVAGGVHALTYKGLTGEWERPQDALFHGAASTLTAGVMYKMIRGEKGNLNLINQEWTASAMRGLSARAPRLAGMVERTGTTFGDATGKLSSQDVAKVAEAGGFETAESLAAGFRRIGLDDLALKFDPATSGLKAGTRATAPEVVRIIEANGLKNNVFEMMSLVGRNTKFDAGAIARSLEGQGVRTLDDFVAMTERPLTSLRAGSQEIVKAGLPDETLLTDAAKSGANGLDDAFLQAAKDNKITRVGDLKKFLAEGGGYEKLTMAERWPLIQAMRNAGLEGSTAMSDVAARGVQIFDVGLGSRNLGKEFRLKNTQSAAFAEASEGVAPSTVRGRVSQWGSDMWSGAKRQVQVSPLEVTEATSARDLARMPRQVEILQRNRNYLKGLVGLGLYRNTSRIYELTQGGMSLGDAFVTSNFPTQHVRDNASMSEIVTAKVMGPFMSTPLAPLLTMKMFSPTGRAVPLWSSPMGKTMGTWGKTMEYIGPNQRLWQNLTSTSASTSMDGLLARSLTGTRNAVAPMIGLSTPMAISTFFDDYGERQFAQDVRTKLDYAGQEEANAPFVDGHRELKTLREYLDEQTKKASDEAAARKAAEDEAARKRAEDAAAQNAGEQDQGNQDQGNQDQGDQDQPKPVGNEGQPGGNVQANPDDF